MKVVYARKDFGIFKHILKDTTTTTTTAAMPDVVFTSQHLTQDILNLRNCSSCHLCVGLMAIGDVLCLFGQMAVRCVFESKITLSIFCCGGKFVHFAYLCL